MATLAFTAIGTTLGGPVGGLVGSLVGRQLDAALFGGSSREGPRLDDLKLTSSSYGSAIPRIHGRMRVGGTIVWSTDLVEHSETSGGSKSGGAVTLYSYSISCAVALSSRPIRGIGRIWADGELLRGEAGDLKVGGQLRIHTGHGDQGPDPLLASAEGIYGPAYRGTALAVFEDLDLGPFGNRIPALTFEVIADEGTLDLAEIVALAAGSASVAVPLPGLAGFACDGGPMAQTLATLDEIYPLACDVGGEQLGIGPADTVPGEVTLLPEPAAALGDGRFGEASGHHRRREAGTSRRPTVLRYYDVGRDYLAGVQRAEGRAQAGFVRTIEFPGALDAEDARALVDAAADRSGWARETMAWRLAELDPALVPGTVVRAPDIAGAWRIESWEWRDDGVELELLRLPHGASRTTAADAGRANFPADLPVGATELQAFELPPESVGVAGTPAIFAAASSASTGWLGASLHVDQGGMLVPLGPSGRRRAVIGHTVEPVGPSPALRFEPASSFTVQLVAADLALDAVTSEAIAMGANRALLGGEIFQFADAMPLGDGQWRLEGLLRGRGGTESAAQAGHGNGAIFVLIDDRLTAIDPAKAALSGSAQIAAIGVGDMEPAMSGIVNSGLGFRPLVPVHPRSHVASDGGLHLGWTRRARGAWTWRDDVEVPLVESKESYLVGVGPPAAPLAQWSVAAPALVLDAAEYGALAFSHPGMPIWVRQVGDHALSDPLLLATLPEE